MIMTDAMIETQEDFFIKIFTSHFICKFRKGCVVLLWKGAGDQKRNFNIFIPNLWPSRCIFLVLLMLNRSPGVHSVGCWFSLLHLISIFFGPQLIRAPSPFGPEWLSLPHLSNSVHLPATRTQLARRTQLSYIIVRCPLDFWNRMFNRHPAEITVMQFRGHSLPMHHSVVPQWDLHLVPYYQP